MTATIYHFPDMTSEADRPTYSPNRLREWRRARGKTLQQVADACNTTQAQIQRLEVGRRELTLTWLERIAAFLDVAVADLLAPMHGAPQVSARERALLDRFAAADENARAAIESVAETLSGYVPDGRIVPLHPRKGDPDDVDDREDRSA